MTVEQSWARIIEWLRANAPVTAAGIGASAGPDAVAAAERAFPSAWPDDLRRWYLLQDGESMDTLWRCVLPTWAVLSLADMAEWSGTYADQEDVWDDLEPAPAAGDNAFTFRADFVPIGENGCAETIFVDLRPGPLHGCVTQYVKGDADTHGPSWPSVAAMLEDVADSLEQSTPCDGYLPTVVDGELDWDLVDADEETD